MSNFIPIQIAVEDTLSEAILRVMLKQSGKPFHIGTCFGKKGSGYLRNKINGFNNAAKGTPFLVLTDLDKTECPPILIQEWLERSKNHNLIFRVAVREVESWILAHRSAFAKFIGVPEKIVPINPDEIGDPKRKLIQLTRKSRRQKLKSAIIPQSDSTAKIGPNYNNQLRDFIHNEWNVHCAKKISPSLERVFNEICNFKPNF